MPKIDLTITISVVIAVCAIISPVITTLLNNHHAYKIRKLDLKLEQERSSSFYKRGVYEEYLRSAGKCATYPTDKSLGEYGQAHLLALAYFPEEYLTELIKINESISDHNWKSAQSLLNKLTPKIRAMLQKQ